METILDYTMNDNNSSSGRMSVLKILVVEDSSFARLAVTKAISSIVPTATFIEAADGEAGLALFLENQPDMIFTDLLMPKMTGDMMIANIRQHDKDVPIVVITANIQKPAREKVEEFKVAGFVSKPVNSESIKIIRELLAGYSHAE